MSHSEQHPDDEPAVIGGGRLPDELVVSCEGDVIPADSLGQQLHWLHKLNPGRVEFGGQIDGLDDQAKIELIHRFQTVLNLRPLRDCIG